MNDFRYSDFALGFFGRPHQAFLGVTLQARQNWLRADNFVFTNDYPGVYIQMEKLGALNVRCEPFQLSASNAFLRMTAIGTGAGDPYSGFGMLLIDRFYDAVSIALQSDKEIGVQVLTNGVIAYGSAFLSPFTLFIPAQTLIGSIAAHAKTVENLPGHHLQFAQPTPVTLRSNLVVTGDELRLLFPAPFRLENLNSLYIAGRGFGALTITNEIATAPTVATRLEIAHVLDSIIVKWADPNRLMGLWHADYGSLDGPYYYVTNPVIFNDPYERVTLPITRTNDFNFFRLYYYPD